MAGEITSKIGRVSATPVPIAEGGTGSSTASGAVDTLGGAAATGSGGLVRATSPTLITPTLGAAAATSITLGGGTALANYVVATFTPTITLVGGVGNTTPVYSTNTGRYTRVGNRCFTDIYLTGDGGDEGAGTGQINISLPITASADNPTEYGGAIGTYINGATQAPIHGRIPGGASNIELTVVSAGALADFQAVLQNNTSRSIRLSFWYEV